MPYPTGPILASACSAAGSADLGVNQAIDRLEARHATLGAPAASPDLALVFASGSNASMLGLIAGVLRRRLDPRHVLAVAAPSVISGAETFESRPAISIMTARLPGVRVTPLTPALLAGADAETIAPVLGDPAELRATFLFADPRSTPFTRLIPSLAGIHRGAAWTDPPPLVGAVTPGDNRSGASMLLDAEPYSAGAVGLSLAGDIRVDTLVSQGCRAFAKPMLITRARNNLILELAGRPAIEAVRDAAGDLTERERALLPDGLFLGLVIDEYKDRFGRGDFLIRRIRAVDDTSGAIAVDELVTPGRTVQLHLRDARTANDDLALLLDAQSVHEPPCAALLFSSSGRGREFFGDAAHDPNLIQRAFRPTLPAERRAKGGQEIDPDTPVLPLAGLMTTAEIAPVSGDPRVHTHSAVLAMFRERAPEAKGDGH